MSISFGQTYLYSHNPEKLYHFLSFLLDVQAFEYSEHKIKFHFQGMDFVIRPSENKNISRTSYFSLKVDDWDELYDLKKTIEFYYYKEVDKNYTITDLSSGIEFTDPDQRRWSVLVGQEMLATQSSHYKSVTNDVRNC